MEGLEDSNDNDYCVIRFSTSAPYKDISFKIVNLEWDLKNYACWKCEFNRGIMYLHFSFKQMRYRR